MKTGDLLFVRPRTFIGHCVSKVMKSEFSHVAMAISDSHIIESQLFKDTQIVENYYDDYILISLDVSDKTRENILGNIHQMKIENIKYDMGQALSWLLQSFVFNHFNINVVKYFDNKEAYICIELILEILNRSGFDLNIENSQLITFDDLIKILSDRGYVK